MSAIIKNFDTVEDVIQTSLNSEGSAYKENEKVLDSIQGKIELFTNAVQTMWTNAINSDVVKTIIDAGTALVKFVDELGLIPSILTAIIAVKAFKILAPTISDAAAALGLLISESVQTGKSISSLAKDTQIFGEVSVASFKKVGTAIKSIGKFFIANPVIAAITAVVAVTGFAVTAYKKVKQAEEEASKEASKYAEEVRESNKSLEEYKTKIDELRSSLDSGNLSEEEAYDVRKQLITIQDELVAKYGKEAEAINLVTGSIEAQKNAIDGLARSNAQDWLNENSKQSGWWVFKGKSPIQKAIEQVEGTQNAFLNLDNFANPFKEAYGEDDYWDKYIEAYNKFKDYVTNELGGTYIAATGDFKFSGKTREEIANIYDQMANWLRDYAKNSDNKINPTSFIGEITSTKDKLVGDKYDTYKANYDAFLENTALTSYTDAYGKILDAQDKFRKAYASGDKKAAQEAKTELENAVVAAKEEANGDDRMANWFGDLNNDFQAAFADIDFDAAWENVNTGLKSSVQKALKDLNLGSDQEILNLGSFIGDDGKLKDGVEGFTQEQADAYNTLKSKASEYGMTIDELVAKLVKLGLVQGSSFNSATKSVEAVGKTLSSYSDTIDKFTSAQSIQDEIIYDNIKLTDEQGDALKELIGDEEDYADAIDSTNGYIVKNANVLNKLISKKKQEAVQNARTEKTQARLKYYELYKKIRKLTGANGELAQSNVKEINALYKEMGAVERTIAKYSLLEQKLLGAADAYQKYEDAKAADEAKDYGSKAEDMISGLIEGLQSAKLGTESFKAAVAGMIPEDVYSGFDTVEEKVAAIANYLKNSDFSKYFTFKFGDDGTLESAEMTLDNVQAFIESAQEEGVFTNQGDWQHFELSSDIKTLDDFCKAMNITKEMAFAMFTEIDSYDAEWLNGDFGSIFDQLDLGLEGNIFMAQKRIAELDVAFANGKISAEQYAAAMYGTGEAATEEQKAMGGLQGQLDKNTEAARESAQQWSEASKNYEDAKKKVEDLSKQIKDADKDADISNLEEQLAKAMSDMNNYGKLMEKYQVSDLVIQVAIDDVQKDIDEVEKTYSDLAKNVEFNNETGKYNIKSEAVWNGDTPDQATIDNYLKLLDERHTLEVMQGESLPTTLDVVQEISYTLKTITDILAKHYGIDIDTGEADDTVSGLLEKLGQLKPKEVVVSIIGKISDDLKTWWAIVTGGTELNGTVTGADHTYSSGGRNTSNTRQNLQYANGTAHASGNWGADKSDTSLVGELGPELRVRGNRWDMLGENGAEFTDIKKGDIIFNHKQTKSLLENGYINSRGKAYASGTSYGISNIFDKLKLNKLAKYAEEMCKQYEELVNGNVDLRKRPHLSPSYEHDLAMGGGYNSFIGSDGEIYASTSAETVTIGDKNKYTIDITPVLENGEVLTSDALANYIDGLVTNGSTQDLLDSDKYNLVIRAVPGEYDEKDWAGFEDELSKYKDGYLNTIMEMFNLGGDKAVESSGFSSVGLAGVVKDLQDNGSYTGKEVASAIDSTSDGMRELDNLINQYVTDVLNAKSLADDIGTDLSQTKYGNVDTNDRQKLYWDEESIDKYGDAIDSWGMKADDLANTYSTLLSSVGEFDGEDIAFTPILQTENGPQLLDSSTVDKYIWGLIDEAKQNDGKWTSDELFQLDTKGLEVDGVVVKNLLEDIGQDADKTAKLFHYVGDTGAIANLEGEIESTSSELVATGENINSVQEKLDKLNATSISDKTFTVTTDYRIIGSGTEQTVHTPGASGRLTIYADGSAHASGDWGVKQDESGSLVGELGPETLVRNGKWKTIGDNGAEMVNLKKGDIIFNHKQTEQLLKNGHINSRGKMVGGQSFAEGNAHVTIVPDYTTPTYYSGASNDNFWTDWNGAADDLSDAADDLSDTADDFKEVFDWFEVLIQEIDDDLNYMSAALENAIGISAKNDIQDQMINVNKYKLTELGEGYKLYADYAAQLLEEVPQQYRDLAKNGGVALTKFLGEANQEVVEAINNYREWAQKASDVRTQQQEVRKEITSISLQKVQTIADEYDRVIAKITTMNDLIQANIDLIDEQGERTSAVMYEEMIKNSEDVLKQLQAQRDAMQKEFDAQVSSGNIEVGSEAWYEGISAIQDVDKSIIDCRKDIESFQNSINQLHWDNFDKLIDAIDNVGTELSNLGDLIDDDDAVDEMGNWTDKGITKMGLLAQEMERAQYRAQQYAEQIDYLNQEYAAGKYSTDEYNEKLQELQNGQWDSIKSYEAAKDALVDLNKARVESAKNAIQKEIDAYSDLISKKKEELQLSKDSHDFQKEVNEKNKNIANIEKQLAAISGDNSASAVARRKKLQAELAAAQEELDELYYSHNVEQQQDALDKNLEDYQDEKDKEMEKLDEYLKNVEQVIADSFATITGNTETVAETLKGIADEYGINLSEAITNPWEQGVIAIGTYQDQLDTSTSAFTAQLDVIKQKLLDLQAEADRTAKSLIDATNQQANNTSSATYTPPKPSSTPSTPSTPSKPAAPSVGSSVTVKKSATNFSRDGGNGTRMQSWVPGTTFTVYQTNGSEVLIGRNGGYTGWVRLSDIEGYRLGVNGVKKNQLAITDEDGLEELVLHAGVNGKLQYLSKGSSVIPSDITENLMKLGQLDPRQVLERNMPKIGVPYIVNNNIELNMSFGNMINIEHADKDSIPEIRDVVKAQLDSYMKGVNQSLKKFTR